MSDHSSGPSQPGSPVGPLPDFQSNARPFRFTWDPSSRRPGPASVSETTEGRGDYFASQGPMGLYSASSTNLALGAMPTEWSSSKHGFNAISTVLNNPHKRQAPPKAHSHLPTVPPADLPRVKRKDFDPYLRAISPEWDRFEKNALLGRDGVAELSAAGPSSQRARESFDTATPTTPRMQRAVSGKAMPPLESVPSVFFEPKFNLGEPSTFNAVTEQREGEFTDPSALAHSLPLLEKMSHYADTIEQHLVREISLRSTSFFAALTNLHELQSESEECLERISKLRGLLKEVDEKGAKRGLEVVRKESKIKNLAAVREGVKLVGGVVDMTGVAKGLVTTGQWGDALGMIEQMESLWDAPSSSSVDPKTPTSTRQKAGVPNGVLSPIPASPDSSEPHSEKALSASIPLSSLHAFTSLPSHLQALTVEIATSLTSELVNTLRSDLVERVLWGSSGNHTSRSRRDLDQPLRDRLRPLLHGLVRTRSVQNATVFWRDTAMAEVREAIRRHLSHDLDDLSKNATPDTDYNMVLPRELEQMSHPDFMVKLRLVYQSLLDCIEGLRTQAGLLVEVLESLRSPSGPVDVAVLQEELSDVVSSAAELSNTRAAKIVTMRLEQHTALDLPSFLAFFNESWSFVLKCEVICMRMIVGLRGVVVSQAKVFLQRFHQARISASAKLVEDEQWSPAEVSAATQHTADIIVDCAVGDSTELVVHVGALQSPSVASTSTQSLDASQTLSSFPSTPSLVPDDSPSKHLRIEERTYFAVPATTEVLTLLLDYLKIIINLTLLTTDTMSRIIEFLKAFNSRTCQVVLGAGAMRSAGLKNITAKHLALASQSLSIMVALIPYIRETFRRHLSQTQAVMLIEFDKLRRDYQEHQAEIHSKLIAIMGDRLSAHIKSLQAVKWDAPLPSSGANGYMELLVKETVTLHKVLSRYLPGQTVEFVMSQVFAQINHRLSEAYREMEVPSQAMKDRMLGDAKFLHQKFSALKNVSTPNNMLETVIAEKRPADAPRPAPAAPMSTTNQRIMGILSRKGTTDQVMSPNADKPLPKPIPSAPSTTSLVSSAAGTPPAVASPIVNGTTSEGVRENGHGPLFAASPTPPPQEEEQRKGFKQVEGIAPEPEAPLPAPPSSSPPTSTDAPDQPVSAEPEVSQAPQANGDALKDSS